MADPAEPIVTRRLILRSPDGERPLDIRLFAPTMNEEGAWFCDYEINWPDNPRRHAGWGADSLQALVITLQMIGIQLYTSEPHKSGRLSAPEPESGYGFPVHPSCRHLLSEADARGV